MPRRYPRLFVLRGLPGSGKTTVARELVDCEIDTFGVSRLTRDEFRRMMHGRRFGAGRQEQLVTAAQHAAIRAVLGEGGDVVVDDTNLRDSQIRQFERLAAECGAVVEVIDLREVPLEECIRRDRLREGDKHVGSVVITKMHSDHIAKTSVAARMAATRAARSHA